MKTANYTEGSFFSINGHYGFPIVVKGIEDARKIASEQIDIFNEGLIEEKISSDIYAFSPEGGMPTYFKILDFAE